MKTIRIFAALALCLGLTACVQDLNTTPIDPNTKQQFDATEIYYKLYASLSTSGLKGPDGPAGSCDIVSDNEGYSVWYRLIWVHNEFPCDGGWWIWNSDAGCSNLLESSWDSENPFVKLLYNRLIFNITLANHFLDNTGGNPEGNDEANNADNDIFTKRAEVRFLRALNYAYMLDFFGNPPFVTTVSLESPKQHPNNRAGLYQWIIDELKACENTLLEQTHIYRVNKYAARMLLARLYLNAEIYTGTADWTNAADYAKLVMERYPLAANYAQLFMGDNDVNPASCEIIFSLQQDGEQTQSWGGSSYCVCASRSSSMLAYGSTDKWECWRSSPELILAFTTPQVAKKTKADETQMPTILKDDRALFSSCVRDADGKAVYEPGFSGPAAYGTGNFDKCWGICKWTGVYSDGTMVGHNTQFVDTDLPIFRSAEACLTYAEALYRQGKVTEALDIINTTVRARAHAVALTSLDDKTLLDEWQREFYSEGRRRMDMVRFNVFTGNSLKTGRHWEGRGRNASNLTSNIDPKYNLYPIPNSDCIANPNLKQNPGF